jgi:deazaflavin-dependent oxidoreductase (nitroreductase family)
MNSTTPLIRLLRGLLAVPAIIAGAVVAFYLLLLGYSTLMRVRWISDRTRQASKRGNRYVRAIAGTRLGMLYFNLAALHHVGRRSGRPYVTPLSAYPLGDGFVLAVAYPHVDWCENLLAAGIATLTWDGKEYPLERPEVISRSEALKAYPLLVRPFLVGPGTNKFIWVHRTVSEQQPAPTSAQETVTASKA